MAEVPEKFRRPGKIQSRFQQILIFLSRRKIASVKWHPVDADPKPGLAADHALLGFVLGSELDEPYNQYKLSRNISQWPQSITAT